MLKYRAKFIMDKLRAGMEISYENYRVKCVNIAKTDRHDVPCVPASGCTFMKTKIPIIRNLYISSVSTLKGEIKYEYIQWDRFEDKLNHRIPSVAKDAYYTYKSIGDETFHYLYNDKHKKTLTYTFIPYDPIEYALMPDCNGYVNKCLNAYEVAFPLDPDLEAVLFQETFKSLVQPRPKDADVYTNGMKDMGLPNK